VLQRELESELPSALQWGPPSELLLAQPLELLSALLSVNQWELSTEPPSGLLLALLLELLPAL